MSWLKNLKSWEGLLFCALVIIIAFNMHMSPEFMTFGNQINLLQLSIEKIIVALVMTFIIINGEIDLSVGSMMGLGAVAFGFMFQSGMHAGVACIIVLLIGIVGGLINGFFIAYLGLPSLVVTLSTLIGYRGIARILVEDRGINDFPLWFNALGQKGFIASVPFALIAYALLAIFFYVVLQKSAVGRKTYVIGTNRNVADFSGIDTARHKLILFMASGLIAAFAGLLFAARVGAVRGDVANGFELDIITIVLLGGVSIFGGSGSIIGTILASLIILNLRNGMALLNITGHIQTGVVGLLLIASVIIPRFDLSYWLNFFAPGRSKETHK